MFLRYLLLKFQAEEEEGNEYVSDYMTHSYHFLGLSLLPLRPSTCDHSSFELSMPFSEDINLVSNQERETTQ